MGQTREKKPSKRAIKAQQQAPELTAKLHTSSTSDPTVSPIQSPTDQTGCPSRNGSLTIPRPSAKSSRSSLRTDRSTQSSASTTPSSAIAVTRPYDPSLIEVVSTPDRGYAVFTTTRIPAGTLILAERPIIRLTATEELSVSTSVEDMLAQRFSALPKSSQKSYLKLHDSEKASFSRVKSIYFSNCYDLGKSDTGSIHGGSAIGLLASRINHSCVPNVQFSFIDTIPSQLANIVAQGSQVNESKENDGMMLFYALRNIPAHRELLANYDSIYMNTEERQMKQQMYYGFRCTCEACTGKTEFWAKSDERRREMSQLKAQIDRMEKRWERGHGSVSVYTKFTTGGQNDESLQNTGDKGHISDHQRVVSVETNDLISSVLSALERLATLLIKEGIMGMDLVQAYRALSKWSRRANREAEAEHWSEKKRYTSTIAFGVQSRHLVEHGSH